MAFGHEKLDVYRAAVHENADEYRTGGIDPDSDPDRNKEKKGRNHAMQRTRDNIGPDGKSKVANR